CICCHSFSFTPSVIWGSKFYFNTIFKIKQAKYVLISQLTAESKQMFFTKTVYQNTASPEMVKENVLY
ncbi:MAG: hypothetical protein ACLUFM_07420, partial [Lachnospiraceae bacterium]